ncbi:MAG: endonuclease [Mariniphaga sp.]|nr:endonuclease [Mariniphaga sp.]
MEKTVLSQPLDYYNGTENLSGDGLKKALHDIIKDHVDFTNSRAKDIINESDSDPDNPDNVVLFYLQESRDADQYGTGGDYINREHVWAKSQGNFGDIRPVDGDAHNLRPADASVNVDRGNKDFDNVQPNGFQHREALDCWYNDNAWEPGPATKGQVARILFYMATRYEGEGEHGIDLELVDWIDTDNNFDSEHGKLSTLLEWNNQYPPSDFERRRNEKLFQIQQNRNPFVDHPEFADRIWKNEKPEPVQFSELSMTPAKPHIGETAAISARVSSVVKPDSVFLFWGDTFNSKQNRKKLVLNDGFYSGQVTFTGQQPGETTWIMIGALSNQDTFLIRGSYVVPERISADQITPIDQVQGEGNESPLLNQKVTIAGRVTANFDNTIYIQDASSVRSGLCIFNSLKTGKVGDSVVARGIVAEYSNLTELSEIEYFYNYGENKAIQPIVIDTRLMNEDYEGMLVTLENVTFLDGGIKIPTQNRTYTFYDEQGQGVLFSEWSSRLPGNIIPAERTSITGIVSQYQGNYQMLARDVTDLSVDTHSDLLNSHPEHSVMIYPNPATNLLHIDSPFMLKSVTVFSVYGSTRSIKLNEMNNIDVSEWQPGLYVLRVEAENNGYMYKKIIVQ